MLNREEKILKKKKSGRRKGEGKKELKQSSLAALSSRTNQKVKGARKGLLEMCWSQGRGNHLGASRWNDRGG